MQSDTSLKDLVDQWLHLDKNPGTQKDIESLWQQGNTQELEKRLRHRIEFGTAGLRGRMEAGFSRMNDLIIIQASQGLCAYVLKTIPGAGSRGIVVGHDHRHNSRRWAELAAAAFIAGGCKVYLHQGLVHTPLVPFSVKKLRAAAGVMITASHNPKQDNGYKVYWENAVQIIGPHDIGIAKSIEAHLEPKTWDISSTLGDLCIDCKEEMCQAYYESVSSMCLSRSLNASSPLKFVNTSMHGVSRPFVAKVLSLYGFKSVIHVREQAEPDADFPTVKFPNPEEKGALDIAMQTAERDNADYVLAQDPDADRFSAAQISDGKWLNFTGDQLGAIFASKALETYKATGKPIEKLAMVASTVSSKMVEEMAKIEGFKFVECLTGFKFIGNTALNLESEGYEVPFGYEEAIGFMFGADIRDKDGVAATAAFAELATTLATQGKNMERHLEDLYEKYGFFETSNSYFICSDPPTIDAIFARIRNFDGQASATRASYPSNIAGLTVTRIVDLTVGYDSANVPTFKPSLPLSSGHMIQFRAQSNDESTGIVLTLRTSGTEPKIKYYLEGTGRDAARIKLLLPAVINELGNSWMEAKRHNLGSA